jgi:hypothetical protein
VSIYSKRKWQAAHLDLIFHTNSNTPKCKKGEEILMNLKLACCSLSIMACILPATIDATQLVTGPAIATNPLFTFDNTVTQKVYSRASATMYIGLEAADDGYSLWSATRPIGNTAPTFTALAGGGSNPIYSLALVSNFGNPKPYLAYTEFESSTMPKVVLATNYNGTEKGTSPELKDADGNNTSGIITLAGMLLPDINNKGYIFAAVAPTTSDEAQAFGSANSGIAVICLTDTLNTINLYQTAANNETPHLIAATRLDPSSDAVRINTDPEIGPFATMYWDDQLQRLYIGLELTTSTSINSGAKAVVVGEIENCGKLNFHNIAPNAAFEVGSSDQGHTIVGTINDTSDQKIIWIHNLRTMHCSTGPSYLIVNGGILTTDDEGNNILYALPLVDTCPALEIQGTIANFDSQLSDKHTFVVPATQPADLTLSTQPAAQVGAGPLPIQASTHISDIEVIGDTVYVSIATVQSSSDENGILYSQALFDKTGKIARWTPWTKRAFPPHAFLNTSCFDKGIQFFAVDAVTGKVWAVDGNTQKVVRVTAWDKGGTCPQQPTICQNTVQPCCNTINRCCGNCLEQNCSQDTPVQICSSSCCTLASRLCTSLPCGCYSVLDLDQATRGFTATTTAEPYTLNRFALFGGCNKVVFAQTSTAYSYEITSPQEVIENFCPTCADTYYLETFLPYPDTQVCINVLEYSRTNTDTTQCYFFAGTDNGLYVYCNNNNEGFMLSELNIETLSQGMWVKIDAFSDPIIDIKTTGLSLYIVSRSVKKGTMTSTVSRVDFEDTIQDMFNLTYTIAQSRQDIFENAPAFTGIQPVAVQVENEQLAAEQLVLATNDGLFASHSDLALFPEGIAQATTQEEAAWARVPVQRWKQNSKINHTIFFEGIAGIDTPIPSTVWPISIEDLCGSRTYQYSWIYQLSSTTTESEPFFGKFVPSFFNDIVRNSAFEQINPISNFWSDSARRFFVISRPEESATRTYLMSFPFNSLEWRVCAPGRTILLFDPYVTATKRFFWVKQIGITGILMAGTNNGVIALE